MISISGAVWIIVYLCVGALIFGLLWLLIDVIGKAIPGEPGQLFIKFARIVLCVLAILVVIGILLSLVSGQPLFRP